jgi:molybdate transport system ATP-binding protein
MSSSDPAPVQREDSLHAEIAVRRGAFRMDLALAVEPGEIVVLVGPSGSGKSTAVSVIAGLLPLDRGRIRFGEEIWCDSETKTHWAPHRRRVGFMHQDFALFPHLDVRSNVMYGPRARGANRAGAASQADAWLERLGLSAFAIRAPSALSGGQRQRVALARALASGARVLLLDEPFGSLDVETRATIRAELHTFLSRFRLPTLFVTHDASDALVLADRIAVLEDGALTQVGSREDLLSRPASRFIAELLGLNYMRAELLAGEGLREARAADLIFHVLTEGPAGTVSLSFPPSAVTLSSERPQGSAQNTFPGRVREAVPLADRIRIVLDCGVIVAADVVREAAHALDAVPGRSLWASVKATAIQVYP